LAVIVILPIKFYLNWKLTLLLFVTMPLVSLTVKYFGQQVHTRFQQIQDFFAQLTARAQENFTGVRVVRAYAQEPAEIEAFNKLNWEYAQKNLRTKLKFFCAYYLLRLKLSTNSTGSTHRRI